jgi:DtxR family transcriptional regulator, Mn-dependent transcriptional regulator
MDKLSSHMEDYLESIHVLEAEQGSVRVKDIAKRLHISRASVSVAMNHLEKQGLVLHPRYDLVRLTEKGSCLAAGVYERHQIIREFLREVLGLGEDVAEKDACRMEHHIGPETFQSIKRFISKRVHGKKNVPNKK